MSGLCGGAGAGPGLCHGEEIGDTTPSTRGHRQAQRVSQATKLRTSNANMTDSDERNLASLSRTLKEDSKLKQGFLSANSVPDISEMRPVLDAGLFT